MPLDNADDFFKKKLAELDQTLPPEVTWNKAQGWQQLQPALPVKRRREVIWYQVAAAVAILVSGLFLLNMPVKKATVTLSRITAAKQNLKSSLPAQPEVKQVARTPIKNSRAMALHKGRIRKNLKKPVSKELALADKTSTLASEQNPDPTQNINTVANNQEAPLETMPETAPFVPTPLKITVVLGGKTNRQLAVNAANEVTKNNRKKSNRLKLQVNVPGEAHPDDSVLAASANLLPDRSAISARIDL
jgi:hypothetical protein